MMPNRHNSRKSNRAQRLLKQFMKGVFRSLWWFSGQQRREGNAVAGFVFPTTLLLLLMVTLTATALTYRTFSRSSQVIAQREQQVIYNAATPAIDRARVKLEFLFQEDNRLPSGVPPADRLSDMLLPAASRVLLNTDVAPAVPIVSDLTIPGGTNTDPYTLPDETRLDLDLDGELDNAWLFAADDLDGDGDIEQVVYSILLDDVGPGATPPGDTAIFSTSSDTQAKADNLVTRTGPLATTEASPLCKAAVAEAGWQVVNQGDASSLQKNFQVNAVVINDKPTGTTFETLEFQQSRIAARASKWGAWFRYDLEVSPGGAFNWNGAMHSDGNIILFRQAGKEGIQPFMVSSEKSCIYSREASEITLGEFDNDGTNGIDVGSDTATTDFQGQFLFAATKNNAFGSANNIDVHTFDTDDTAPNVQNVGNGGDSVDPDGGGPIDLTMNPLVLFTEDREQHIDPTTWSRNAAWNDVDSELVGSGRVYNDDVSRPFVDDFFRADYRWGPRPRYRANDNQLDMTQFADIAVGTDIRDTSNADYVDDTANQLTNSSDGLDGFWERQAVNSGTRIIAGQRLELGNANGWGYNPTESVQAGNGQVVNTGDPLYPAQTLDYSVAPYSNTRIGGANEQLHRKSLMDNLAAVQGMVVYHYEINGGDFPAACVALTAHPGTRESIVNSRTFNNYPSGTALKTDFLTGQGTNGWEFSYPTAGSDSFATEANFEVRYNSTSSGLRKALNNLAYFAGDPDGGAPSFTPLQDAFIHPFPYLSMWGDFSILRRIVLEGDAGGNYASLSPADRSTLHSTACTLSMLGYNLSAVETEFAADTDYIDIAPLLLSRIGTGTDQIELADVASTPPDEWIRLADVATAATDAQIARMRLAAERWQIERDRTFGFATGQGLAGIATPTTPVGGYDEALAEFTLAADAGPFTAGLYSVSCDPNYFTQNKGIANAEQALAVALALCPKPINTAPNNLEKAVKYPSLYYLFPKTDHDQKDISLTTVATSAQYETEEYIDATAQPEVAGTNDDITTYTANAAADIYKALEPSVIAGTPKATGSWVLPVAANADGLTDPDDAAQAFRLQVPAGTGIDVAFLDKGLYDGRELLNVRVLDLDLEALTTQVATVGGDYWLSADAENRAEGVVYAFREDAVREDEIVRPQSTTAGIDSAFCSTVNKVTTGGRLRVFNLEHDADCYMNVLSTAAQDPPLTDEGISLKPVDFVQDGDRRPHGFRLRTLSGNPANFSGGNPAADSARMVGMTFVTDNSVYVLGDFNPHSNDGTVANLLEEFDETILGGDFDFAAFYGANRDDLNTDTFANLSADHWRPVEILSDSMSILSNTFRDGAISDTVTVGDGGTPLTSYTNQTRPDLNGNKVLNANWVQEDPNDVGSPLWVDRNGVYYWTGDGTVEPFYAQFTTDANNDAGWIEHDEIFNERHASLQVPTANDIYVNAIFVSGIVPLRAEQGYGGLHNFPRFQEFWSGKDVNIQGAFLQLNFSTAGTGAYEQEAYEPGDVPTTREDLGYYRQPVRRWGYDVGLLYVPPSAAARRFVSFGNARSEYFKEIPADDPYIVKLRCAEDASNNKVFGNDLCP